MPAWIAEGLIFDTLHRRQSFVDLRRQNHVNNDYQPTCNQNDDLCDVAGCGEDEVANEWNVVHSRNYSSPLLLLDDIAVAVAAAADMRRGHVMNSPSFQSTFLPFLFLNI